MSHLPAWIIVLSQLSTLILASPIYAPQFLSGGTGRNIRHLPCRSLRSGDDGVCMFAFNCAKRNGTHLGTCVDRFFFGSCCKLDNEPAIFPEDNTIEENLPASSFVTTESVILSNDIPDYFARPKPIKPVSSTPSSSQINLVTTQSVQTSTQPHKIVTKRPFSSTPYTTTQPPIGLLTFQTVQNYSQASSTAPTTESTLKTSTSASSGPSKPFRTETPTIITTIGGPFRPQASSTGTRPVVTDTTTTKPVPVTKPLGTRKPVNPSTSKPVSSATEKIPPSTRFPPRNATTTSRPVQLTTTKKPGHNSASKKPSVTTKRPIPVTRKPVTITKPPSTVILTTKPVAITEKPFSTSVDTQTVGPVTTPSSESLATTSGKPSSTAQSSTQSRPSQRPIDNRPTNGTTSKPFNTSTKPRPSSKPIKTNTTSSSRPTTIKTTPRPQQTSTEKPILTTSSSSSASPRPSTLRPSSIASTKPTERPTKPSKPSRPTRPTSTTLPTTTTTESTTQASTFSVTSFIYNGSTLANEVLPPKISATVATTTEKVTQTTHSPGFVTWSSNSDDDVTKGPETSATTSDTTQEEAATEPEWSPITSPDGWIMIQSPTTERPSIVDKPTKPPSTSARPTSETTERVTTPRPTIPTILSTIASVTTATDLPVPMETLNMSDYKQVCGRRLFPESRIVGGENSTFGKWPWQISLRQWRTKAYLHKCGAALLNENWAITAAHCVENVPPSDLLLRIGEHDLANEDEPYGFQERRVQIVASHPQFDPRTFEYDLALLRFYEPLEPFQPNILPVCLPDDDENYVGHSAYVTGWGRLFEDGPLPSVLQEVSVPVINNTLCEGMYRNAGYIEHIPHIFICAGWRKGGFDSCEGDSGGPMVIRRPRDKRWILAGVISWGIGCAEPNQPGVYTRISEFREWINQILQF